MMEPVAWLVKTRMGNIAWATWQPAGEPLVRLSDAEARIGAERLRFEGDLDKWMKTIGAGISGYQPEAYAVMDAACDELVRLRARAEATAALLKEAGKALEPFSEMAGELFARNFEDSDKVVVMQKADRTHIKVTFADFRAARSIAANIGVKDE